MATLMIKRGNEYVNAARKIGIYLDGNKLGTVANASTQIFEIPEGKHHLHAKLDWCSSRDFEFSIAANETRHLKLTGIAHSNNIMLATSIVFILHIILVLSTGFNYLILLTIPAIVILIYYFTIGRKDYLVIRDHDFIP
jgi:hypothetical protein